MIRYPIVPGVPSLSVTDISAERGRYRVVYKIDRLTRSLADFAKTVEILDAKGALCCR
jgi:DNA invertase Pin-like site-specific DNA recombinase